MTTTDIGKEAVGGFAKGYNCAESLVAAFNERYPETKIDLALVTPFGAGLGARRDLCGILIAGTMILGRTYGRTDSNDLEQKLAAYKVAGAYYRWFKERFGAVQCRDIVPGKFTGHTDRCAEIMRESAEYLADAVGDGAREHR